MGKRKRNQEGSKGSSLTNGHMHKDLAITKKPLNRSEHVTQSTVQQLSTSLNGNNDDPKRSNPSHAKAETNFKPSKVLKTEKHVDVKTEFPTIQIVTGSYERVLHGITANIHRDGESVKTVYADSFLFHAHQSAIRSLALSPMPDDASQGVYLATGGSDERVNIYSLSPAPVPEADSKGRKVPIMPSLGPNHISENPMNRDLGTLVQHSSSVTALHFPSRSKLISASEDNTISFTRMRDLEVMSTVKAPRPKVSGQASGDSATAGTTPAGINDFAIHPSMKLMVSVGRGERSMRLWNLVTGKKAGVLNFDRSVLQSVKEGKYSHGEGRKIRWNRAGTEFVISFERGAVVFGQDSKARYVLMPQKLTKIHQIAYLNVGMDREFIAMSTDDGKVLFFDATSATSTGEQIPVLSPFAYAGGQKHSITARIKDFQILDLGAQGFQYQLLVVGCSNGDVKTIVVSNQELLNPGDEDGLVGSASSDVYATNNRITCLVAFVMLPAHDIEGGLSEAESMLGSELESDESSDSE